jgi:hypothetical protein
MVASLFPTSTKTFGESFSQNLMASAEQNPRHALGLKVSFAKSFPVLNGGSVMIASAGSGRISLQSPW